MDARKNFAFSLVATAPSPATTGTEVGLTASTATRFPTVPFNVVAKPFGAAATTDNAEILRVTGISGDILTVTRAQGGTTAKAIDIGWEIYQGFLVADKDELATTQFDANDKPTIESEAATTPVNNVVVKNAATGAAPEIRAKGTDANIDLSVLAKGTGNVKIGAALLKFPNADGTVGQVLRTDGLGVLSWVTPTAGQAVYDAVVAPSGADYTTVGAALAAGKRSIYVMNGTYNESALNTAWTGTEPIFIRGESRTGTILQMAAASTGWINLNIAGSVIMDITVKVGAAITLNSDGLITLGAANCAAIRCDLYGHTNMSGGHFIKSLGDSNQMLFCRAFGNTIGFIYYCETGNDPLILGNEYYCSTTANFNFYYAFIKVQTACKKPRIIGNRLETTATQGENQAISAGSPNAVISNNIIHLPNTRNLSTLQYAIAGGNYQVISGNMITTGGHGVYAGSYSQITGNYVALIANTALAQTGLNIGGPSAITGNTVVGNTTAACGIVSGVNNTVVGNCVIDFTSTTTLQGVGIASTGGVLEGNMIYNCTRHYSDTSAGKATARGKVSQTFKVAASTTATTLDFRSYKGFHVDLTSNTTFTFTVDNENRCAETFELWLVQDATGSRVVTWPVGVTIKWQGGVAPTLTTTAASRDYVKLVYDPTDNAYMGTYVLGFA